MMLKAKGTIVAAPVVALILLVSLTLNAFAANPHPPVADTYTDGNYPDDNFGEVQTLLLSASNLGSCSATTYLWFKFDIPATIATITTANLSATFGSLGSGQADLELLATNDATWVESGLTWSNQGPVASTLTSYATAENAAPGSTIVLGSQALANFLNDNKGQTVTLVVRADCQGTVGSSVALMLSARENAAGSGVALDLRGPTAVTVRSLEAGNFHSPMNDAIQALLVVLAVSALGWIVVMRKKGVRT